MPGSKRVISKKHIEKEIYNTFVLFKTKRNITIAEFLNRLDVTKFILTKYRKIKFSYESLFKLILFRKLKGIRFQTQLVRYLKRHRTEFKLLGFNEVPDQTTISYYLNKIFDEETRELINFIVKKIETISNKFDILFDIQILEPELPKQTSIAGRTLFQKKHDKTREICRYFKKRFTSVIDLNLGNNIIYSKNTFIDLLLHLCERNDYAENGAKTFQIDRSNTPTGETLLYHLKNYKDIDQVKRMFTTLFEMIWETARKANLFDMRRQVDVAIDFTEWFFYGDKNAPMIMEKKPERGTTHCYKFATIDVVERNKRFTLLALPFGPWDSKEEVLKTLLNYAKQRIKINRVLVDRGFFDQKSIDIFNRYHVKYLMPCTANPRIKRILEVMPAPTVVKDYQMGMTLLNVAVVKDEFGIKRAFATNIDFNENDVNLSEHLFKIYGKRWGIETGYRVKKHTFRSKTTSKNYFIRLFFFLFSVLLYNLWILIDILLLLALFGRIRPEHILRSKYFLTILLKIDPGG